MHNVTKNKVVAPRVRVVDFFFDRLKGLMFDAKIAPGDALVIKPCRSIHSCFMRFPIDAAFVRSDGKVLKIIRGFAPWRASPYVRAAAFVVEAAAGQFDAEILSEGDVVEISAPPSSAGEPGDIKESDRISGGN